MHTIAAFGPVAAWHAGFGWLFFLIPLFWFLLIGAIVFFAVRAGRRRRAAFAAGFGGPWGHGHGYGPWAGAQAARSAERTLAERFAQGDIDEQEYRARLEVLRANAPQPPFGPGAQRPVD